MSGVNYHVLVLSGDHCGQIFDHTAAQKTDLSIEDLALQRVILVISQCDQKKYNCTKN